MGLRGELFTTHVVLDNRSYFFNVKENRTGDIFLQVVESKNVEGAKFDRHAIVVFEEDMQHFFKGLDESLAFIGKARKQRKKDELEKKASKEAQKIASGKRSYRRVVQAVSFEDIQNGKILDSTSDKPKKTPKKIRVIKKT